MDIGNILSYNEDTVHSGSFLEELTEFGKETMHRGIRRNKVNNTGARGQGRIRNPRNVTRMSVLLVFLVLCGCTRKEQLVLETGTDTATTGFVAETGKDAGTTESVPLQAAEEGLDPVPGQTLGNAAGVPESTKTGINQTTDESAEQADLEQQTICVHVCGAVKNPDVYELPAGSRVYEAVKQAGGFTEEADESYVNQAQMLADGVKLVIPTTEQIQAESQETLRGVIGVVGAEEALPDPAGGDTAAEAADGKININTATQEQLCKIPGIGATRAAAIVSYRQEHGGFTKIEDIMNVSGIKEGTYVKIKDSITVN